MASPTPSTTLTEMMASSYSVTQSSSRGGRCLGDAGAGFVVATNGAAGGDQRVADRLEMGIGDGAVDEQRLGGAADRGATHLGVDDHLCGEVEVGARCAT